MQPPVQHPNTIKEGFIYARKEKDRSGCSCCGSARPRGPAPAVEAPAAEAKESKTRKSAKAPARRGRPPLAPELYVEFSGKQYNVTDIIDRAKADYRATHKVGVQSCKVYVKPEEDAAYYVINKVSGKLEL